MSNIWKFCDFIGHTSKEELRRPVSSGFEADAAVCALEFNFIRNTTRFEEPRLLPTSSLIDFHLLCLCNRLQFHFRLSCTSLTRFQLRYTTWLADLETEDELFIQSDFISSRSEKLDTCYRHRKVGEWSFFERKLKIEIFMIGWMRSWKRRQKSKCQERLQAHVLPLLMITNVLSRFMAFEAPLSMLFAASGAVRRRASPTLREK